jgi:F0F1-type ATP synthase membrane subunit c/vacuolar-type H+-ATPase subunit K
MCNNKDGMKVRSVLLAVALCCGLAAICEAGTQTPAAAHAKAMAQARKRAKKQGKARIKAVRKRSNASRAVKHRAPKH